MARSNHFFYPGLAFWLLALGAWWFFATSWALAAAGMALVCFILHISQRQVLSMFGKNKTPATPTPSAITPATSPIPAAISPERLANGISSAEDKPGNTVIASDVQFNGNLCGTGQIYIYGEVEGNVHAEGGLVKVMRHGQVTGNIVCRELIIDGTLVGECTAENISIEEHGYINGAMSYAALTVKKGAIFTGTLSHVAPSEPKTNVIGFTTESLTTTSETLAETEEVEDQPAVTRQQS